MVNVKRTSVTKRHGRYGQICKNRRGLDYCYGWLIVVFDSVIALFPTIITGRYRAYPIESSWIYVKTIGSIERDGTFLLFPFVARCAIDSAKTSVPSWLFSIVRCPVYLGSSYRYLQKSYPRVGARVR